MATVPPVPDETPAAEPFGRRPYDNLHDPVTRLERIAKIVQAVGVPVVLCLVFAAVFVWESRRNNAEIRELLTRLAYYGQQTCINVAGDDPAAIARCNVQPPATR